MFICPKCHCVAPEITSDLKCPDCHTLLKLFDKPKELIEGIYSGCAQLQNRPSIRLKEILPEIKLLCGEFIENPSFLKAQQIASIRRKDDWLDGEDATESKIFNSSIGFRGVSTLYIELFDDLQDELNKFIG